MDAENLIEKNRAAGRLDYKRTIEN
jgi:hypothetical protein